MALLEHSILSQFFSRTRPQEFRAFELSLNFAGHDEQRLAHEGFVFWPQPFGVVVFVDVDDLLASGNHIDRHIVVAAVAQTDQTSGFVC